MKSEIPINTLFYIQYPAMKLIRDISIEFDTFNINQSYNIIENEVASNIIKIKRNIFQKFKDL